MESPPLGQTPTSQCRYATAILSPVEIKSKMSRVTLAPPTRSAPAMRKFGVTALMVPPPVVSEQEHLLFVNIFVDIPSH